MSNLKPASGTRDFLPAQVKLRARMFDTIRRTFELGGFEPIETPAFERIETLMDKYGEEGDKLIFKILRRGEAGKSGDVDLALRYDLTVPMARFYARHRNELPSPFKRYQLGPVWRADRPGRGRFREFYQCDVDIIGSDSPLADAEVLITLGEVYSALGLAGCVFKLNSRVVLYALLDAYGVTPDQRGDATIALDKLDKIGGDGVAEELGTRGLAGDVIDRIRADIGAEDLASRVRERVAQGEAGRAGLAALDQVQALAQGVLGDRARLEFEPFLARGLDYYTGVIFEIFHPELPMAMGSGGRYDGLISDLAGVPAPACGGSIGVERVALVLESMAAAAPPPRCQVMVAVWGADGADDALGLAARLRASGLRAEVFLGTTKIGKQMSRAGRQGIPCVVLRGPDEIAAGRATVKFLATGEQLTIDLETLSDAIAEHLADRPSPDSQS